MKPVVFALMMSMRIRFLLTFWLMTAMVLAQYDHLQFQHITTAEGLSQGVVTSIKKDSRGFVWMTTYDGINRFDGTQVVSNDGIAPGLTNVSYTTSIIEDSKGMLWFGSAEALIKFDYHQNRFFTYSLQLDKTETLPNTKEGYYPIAEREGKILCNTASYPRCYIFDSDTESFSPFFVLTPGYSGRIEPVTIPTAAVLFNDIFSFVWYDKDKGTTLSWMKQLADKSWHWASLHLPVEEGSNYLARKKGDQVELLFWIHHNHVERNVMTHSNFYVYDIRKEEIAFSCKANYRIADVQKEGESYYISSVESGIHIVDENTGRETGRIHYDPNRPTGLRSDNINCFMIKDNQLWAASWGKGVDYASLDNALFTPHISAQEATDGQTSNYIRGIVEDAQGHFWCNVLLKGIIELDNELNYVGTVKGTEHINSASIFMDDDQRLYFGSQGMWSYDIRRKELKKLLIGNDTQHQGGHVDEFYYFTTDQYHRMYATSMSGTYRIDIEKNRLYPCLFKPQQYSDSQQFGYIDQHDQLYSFSAVYGLNIFNIDEDTVTLSYSFAETFTPRHAYEQNDSILWIGTTAGLLQFNTKALKVIKWYTTQDGLPNNVVYAIAPDTYNRLWLSTNKGLCNIDLTSQSIIAFTDDAGQQEREYNRNAVCIARDGRILFGGVNGITAVHTDDFNRNLSHPIIQFTAINNDEEINPFDHHDQAHIKVLKAGSSLIEFHFVGIDYNNSKRCRLRYKMDGVDQDWRVTGNPSSARYVNLKPGRYTFHVMGANSNGEWPQASKSFYFEIPAFWWQTIWFKGLVILGLVVLMYLMIRLWLAQKWNEQKHQLEKELAILKEHERISADLHDDIGSTLSSISVYSELADKYYEARPEKSHEIVHKISVQTRELMTRIEDIIWSLKPHTIDKTAIKSRLQDYALELLSGKSVAYNLDVDTGIDELLIEPYLRKNVLLIIKEAIHNSAKYSNASLVSVSIHASSTGFIILVADNGVGFDERMYTKGNGLRNMKKRSEVIGGTFSIVSGEGQGTVVEIHVSMASIRHQ